MHKLIEMFKQAESGDQLRRYLLQAQLLAALLTAVALVGHLWPMLMVTLGLLYVTSQARGLRERDLRANAILRVFAEQAGKEAAAKQQAARDTLPKVQVEPTTNEQHGGGCAIGEVGCCTCGQ